MKTSSNSKSRGSNMKITGSQPSQGIVGNTGTDSAGKTDKTAAAPTAVIGSTAAAPALESQTLAPAREALAAMPEIDQAKVDSLKAALARGEINFDANRLAKLIERFHGGKP